MDTHWKADGLVCRVRKRTTEDKCPGSSRAVRDLATCVWPRGQTAHTLPRAAAAPLSQVRGRRQHRINAWKAS